MFIGEHTVSATYQTSKIDNITYCMTNGQFTRHLRENNLTYQQYYEKYVTGVSPKCECGASLTFYQRNQTYANSCGSPACVGKTVSRVKQSLPAEVKATQSENYRKAHANKTIEQKHQEYESRKATCLTKYGVPWPTKTTEFKEKAKSSKLAKYGDASYNNSVRSAQKNRSKTADEQRLISNKRRSTNLARYGVENTFLGQTRNANKGNASVKDYRLPSGKVVGIRGDEPKALDKLISLGYNEDDIRIHDNYSSAPIIFEYVAVNRHHKKYYPDIYLPKENKIIEVKSRWWWDGNGAEKYKSRLENNIRKRAAVVAKGYIYEVWLFDGSDYKVLTNDTDFQA